MAKGRRASGDGSIYQRTDGRWVASAEVGLPGTKRRRRSFVRKTRESARQALLEAQRAGLVRSSSPPETSGTVKALIEEFIADRAHRVKPKTLQQYRDINRLHIAPYLGNAKVDSFTADAAARLLDHDLVRAKVSASNRRVVRVLLHAAFKMAVRRRRREYNPIEGTDPVRVPRQRMQVWTEQEARAFLEHAAGDWYEHMFVIALNTGLRPGEQVGLQWSDVDLKNNTIHIQQQIQELKGGELHYDEIKTSTGRRAIYLPKAARSALIAQRERLLSLGIQSKWCFPNTEGGASRWNNIRRRSFFPIMQAAGVRRIRPYDLRHTFATLHLSGGTPIKVVSEMLGHASVTITADVYMHVLPHMQREAAERMDRAIG